MRKEINITKGINNISELLVLSGRSLGEKQREKAAVSGAGRWTNDSHVHSRAILGVDSSAATGILSHH